VTARLRRLVREVATTALLVIVVFAASRMVVQNVQVHGTSMLPTLQNGEYVLVDTLSYHLHAPARGDIIIFHPPVDPRADYVKRVIGLPGEAIQVTRGTVYVNGKALAEPYVRLPHTYSWGPGRVPRGDIFALGDNRDISYDSHLWRNDQGQPAPFLPTRQIIGRAMLAYWPAQDLHVFTSPAFAWRTNAAPGVLPGTTHVTRRSSRRGS
jgi:signal peptidase I